MYQAGNIQGATVDDLRRSMQYELDKLASSLSQPVEYAALKTLYASPSRIFDGMIVKADGTTWNPGSGAGVYCRVVSSWVKL
jgi:hypothetical protein